jgi:DNA-binding NarL/FixJ family response regulator
MTDVLTLDDICHCVMGAINVYTVYVDIDRENKIRILIIDKHEAVRRALLIRLSVPNHFEVVGSVSDINTALCQMASLKPNVVILGLQNASNDDLFHIALVVREIVNETAVVIALAPYIDAVERELLLQAGAKRYLLKHINSKKLIQEIELSSPSMLASH